MTNYSAEKQSKEKAAADQHLKELGNAMFKPSMPCNPVPFLIGLKEAVLLHGSDYIRTDEAKRLLWVINTIAYGQISNINQAQEWDRLYKLSKENQGKEKEAEKIISFKNNTL